MTTTEQGPGSGGKSVQDYIDETPRWRDGTPVAFAPMTAMQWRIWALAAGGKFFEGLVVFMTGVALPLLSEQFSMTDLEHGIVSAASIFGILVGALTLGGLSDRVGRRTMFIFEMFLFAGFLAGLVLTPSFGLLVFFLFGIGVALGCDYPTAHLIISESIPSNDRGRLVLGAFGFQAVGVLSGAVVGYIVLANVHDLSAWRWMYGVALIPAVLVAVARFGVTESGPWLLSRGDIAKAEAATAELLRRWPRYPKHIELEKPAANGAAGRVHGGYAELFDRKNLRATVLASVPWFLQDLGTYGIGIFTPTILATSFGHPSASVRNVSDLVSRDLLAAKGAAAIDVLLIVGILVAAMLADRVGRIKLQIVGFIGCAAGLLIASFSTTATGGLHVFLLFAGFMLFDFMTNMGPNAQTYLLAGEVFPTHIRAKGAGFAAAFAKIGGVMTAFLFPILLANLGTQVLLYGLVCTSLFGALVTYLFRIEPKGTNLDRLSA